MSYRDRIDAPGPKRLLAIDGGGIRGIVALEILARLERELRVATGRPDLVLADVFDYIGGTSTGAIIAACLSLGFTSQRILDVYLERGAEMFDRARLLERLHHQYDDDPLEAILKAELGSDTTFGSDRLRTLLLLVLRNATTDSPWPLSNNPRAAFNDPELEDCNLDLPLWQLVRASTAAPTYFAPETVRLGSRDFVFVDGAVTPFNNPALQLFLMATVDAYRLGWPTGEDRLLLVSVGTGNTAHPRPDLEEDDMHVLFHAKATPAALMFSTAAQQDMLCRLLGTCRSGEPLDSEVGDLRASAPLLADPLFTYLRYDLELTERNLERLGCGNVNVRDVVAIDSVDHLDDLCRVGRAIAELQVDISHLDGFTD
jgi:Patatin-like phospholipase